MCNLTVQVFLKHKCPVSQVSSLLPESFLKNVSSLWGRGPSIPSWWCEDWWRGKESWWAFLDIFWPQVACLVSCTWWTLMMPAIAGWACGPLSAKMAFLEAHFNWLGIIWEFTSCRHKLLTSSSNKSTGPVNYFLNHCCNVNASLSGSLGRL